MGEQVNYPVYRILMLCEIFIARTYSDNFVFNFSLSFPIHYLFRLPRVTGPLRMRMLLKCVCTCFRFKFAADIKQPELNLENQSCAWYAEAVR